jgi:hypothetical protein
MLRGGPPPPWAERAASSIAALRSNPVTLPPLPNRRAAVRATTPVPQAMSNTLTRLQYGHLDEIVGPRSKNTWHKVTLVILWRASDELPSRLGFHLAPPYVWRRLARIFMPPAP